MGADAAPHTGPAEGVQKQRDDIRRVFENEETTAELSHAATTAAKLESLQSISRPQAAKPGAGPAASRGGRQQRA